MNNNCPIPSISILALLVLSSCSDRPKEVLSEKKTVDVLTDLHIANAYADIKMSGNPRDSSRINLANGILKNHGIDRATFDTTIAWYGHNIDQYHDMMVKVDASIEKRRRHLIADNETTSQSEGSNLWPYGTNMVLSMLSHDNTLAFNIDKPSIEKGEVLKLQFRTLSQSYRNVMFGLEYDDGSVYYTINNTSGGRTNDIILQTDTSHAAMRIFGSIKFSDGVGLPVFIDSISINKQPFDSLEYRRLINQQRKLKGKFSKKKPDAKDIKVAGDTIETILK